MAAFWSATGAAGTARSAMRSKQIYGGRTDEVAELLALHFARSHDAEKAVDYRHCGRRKIDSAAGPTPRRCSYFDDALIACSTQCQTRRQPASPYRRCLKHGEVKFAARAHAGHYTGTLEQIRSVVDQTGDPRRRATWHYWGGFLQILTGGRPHVAIGHCREAAEIASVAGLERSTGFRAILPCTGLHCRRSSWARRWRRANERSRSLRRKVNRGGRPDPLAFEHSGELPW